MTTFNGNEKPSQPSESKSGTKRYAAGETFSQNWQNLQPIEFLLVAFAPWLHVGSPFGQGSQGKLWFVLQSIQ